MNVKPIDNDLDLKSRSSELIPKSYISKIVTKFLAGTTSLENSDGTISFSLHPNFVAVTGETGSGKSLLFRTAANLLLGGKATSSLIAVSSSKAENYGNSYNYNGNNSTTVGLVAHLGQIHLDYVNSILNSNGLQQCPLQHDVNLENDRQAFGLLHLERIIYFANGSTGQKNMNSKRTLKSKCYVNGQPIGLKVLRLLTSSLLTTVDAAAASTALNRPASRLSVLDFGLSETIKRNFLDGKRHYLSLRRKRQQLQEELTQRQRALLSYDDEINANIMNSWIQEFHDFEQRMDKLRIRASTFPVRQNSEGTTAIHLAFHKLAKSKWCDYVAKTSSSQGKKENSTFEGEPNDFYSCLLAVHNELKALESQLAKSRQAYDALLSLSSSSISVISATERVRKILLDMSNNKMDPDDDDPIFASVENTHDLLNTVEYAIRKCAQSIDDNDNDRNDSIVTKLELMRRTAPISLDEMEQHVASWNSLARKHGVSPYNLVSCQRMLMEQYEGNEEAKVKLLPAAVAEEEKAKKNYQICYNKLHEARLVLSSRVSGQVTKLLQNLGMNGCQFTMQLQKEEKVPELAFTDKLDFALSYGLSPKRGKVDHRIGVGSASEFIASSGEKARILLAMETVLPGSIGACCRKSQTSDSPDVDKVQFQHDGDAPLQNLVAPIAVMYDEIDAHVGGQAVVALAKMLFEQSRSSGQIISITHSASVAAFADQHLVINRAQLKDSDRMVITIIDAFGEERRKELARMTSGDMAAEEASRFAEALLREREQYISRAARKKLAEIN